MNGVSECSGWARRDRAGVLSTSIYRLAPATVHSVSFGVASGKAGAAADSSQIVAVSLARTVTNKVKNENSKYHIYVIYQMFIDA